VSLALTIPNIMPFSMTTSGVCVVVWVIRRGRESESESESESEGESESKRESESEKNIVCFYVLT